MNDRIIQTKALYSLLHIEPFIILALMLLINWLFYRFFLQQISGERHRNLKRHFRFLFRNFITLTVLFAIYWFLHDLFMTESTIAIMLPYLGVLCLFFGLLIFVKACRLFILQYLFLQSMKTGVPLLLVNIFTLVLSIVLFFWAASTVFGIQLTPLLATSAAFSIILGLALQDTLGNLVAGIALQLDKSFEIGDWLEVVQGLQRSTGQVKEISWRSTLMVGFSDEKITIPNRNMAAAIINNFSTEDSPVARSHIFRIGYGEDVQKAQEVLIKAASEISEIRGIPGPYSYIDQVTESWIALKVGYYLDNFGAQYVVGDKVMRKGIEALRKNGIAMAQAVLEVKYPEEKRIPRPPEAPPET